MAGTAHPAPLELTGRRITLRTLTELDYDAWYEVRTRCRDWLVPWEPRPRGNPPPAEDRGSFSARCAIRERSVNWARATALASSSPDGSPGRSRCPRYPGPLPSAYIGYWVDQALAGQGYVPEAVVMTLHFAFEALGLHRVEISIIPRNQASRRVVEKLGVRMEGVAERFLEIDGTWEDHARFAMTSEEWAIRKRDLLWTWLGRG